MRYYFGQAHTAVTIRDLWRARYPRSPAIPEHVDILSFFDTYTALRERLLRMLLDSNMSVPSVDMKAVLDEQAKGVFPAPLQVEVWGIVRYNYGTGYLDALSGTLVALKSRSNFTLVASSSTGLVSHVADSANHYPPECVFEILATHENRRLLYHHASSRYLAFNKSTRILYLTEQLGLREAQFVIRMAFNDSGVTLSVEDDAPTALRPPGAGGSYYEFYRLHRRYASLDEKQRSETLYPDPPVSLYYI